jgi:hypothetical protein
VLSNTALEVSQTSLTSTLSVEWINIEKTGYSDLELASILQRSGITVLPGRHFFWNSSGEMQNQFIRIAMLKPETVYTQGLVELKNLLCGSLRFLTETQGVKIC